MTVELPIVPSGTVAQARLMWQLAIQAAIGAITALNGGIANTVYVSKLGNDSTGVRGSIVYPFLTVQAAMNAAQSGDTVLVGPGIFQQTITWPHLTNVSLVGSGRDATTIQQVGTYPLQFDAGYAYQGVNICDLTLGAKTTAGCFVYKPNVGVTTSFQAATPLVFRRVMFAPDGVAIYAIDIETINNVLFEDCQNVPVSGVSQTYLSQVLNTTIRDCDLPNIEFSTNMAVTMPSEASGLPGQAYVYDSRIGSLTCDVNAHVFCDTNTIATRISTGLFDNGTSALSGLLEFHGMCLGDADLEFTCAHANTTFFRCSGAFFIAGSTLLCNAVDEGTSSFRGSIYLTGATIATLYVGPWANAFAQNTFIGTLTSGGSTHFGYCERDSVSGTVSFAGSAAAQNVTFACPMVTANYNVVFEFPSSAAAAANPVYVTSKANSGFTATPALAGAANTRWTAILQY